MSSTTIELKIDLRKIYFFGVCIAALYGLTPLASNILFNSQAPYIFQYTTDFAISSATFFLLTFPIRKHIAINARVKDVNYIALMLFGMSIFIYSLFSLYGDFYTAFIASYTERTGTEISGILKYLFYPSAVIFQFCHFIGMLILASGLKSKHKFSIILLNLVATTLIIGLGSRNILLWCYSGAIAMLISRMRYKLIICVPIAMYLFAVGFAFMRNTGLISYLLGFTEHSSELTWEYFDPMVHEFGASYRLYETLLSDASAVNAIQHAPYSLWESFIVNLMPSAIKPDDYIGFTDYISFLLAAPGEGIGSSPMTEALLTDYLSILLILVTGIVFFLIPSISTRVPYYTFLCIGLSSAVFFNFWRIGSPELTKMVFSMLFIAALSKPILGMNIHHLARTSQTKQKQHPFLH